MSVLCNILPYVFMFPIICNGMTGNHKTVVVGFFSPKVIQHSVANGFSVALQLCAVAQTHLCLSEALTFVQRNTRDRNFPGREMSTGNFRKEIRTCPSY